MRTPYSYCDTCHQAFFYPLPACTRCGGVLLDRDPEVYTIVGKTTVFLPSNEHPKVPYHILRLEDEFGLTHLRKTMRQYEVGQQLNRTVGSLSPETVLIAKCGYDPERALSTLLSDLQLEAIDSEQRILMHIALTPHPIGGDFLQNVTHFLHSLGATPEQITFVARLPEGLPRDRWLKKNGLQDLISSDRFIDLTTASHETISYGDALYDVPRPLVNSDWLIQLSAVGLSTATPNAPITAALAEIFPGGVGLRTQRALDLSPTSTKVLPRRLHLVDGRGDTGLPTASKSLFLAGRSAMALDRALCTIYHVEPDEAVRHTALNVLGEELEAL